MIQRSLFRYCLILLCIASASVGLTGCSTLSYYSQSVVGHSKLMLARKPVERVIASADAPLKQQLLLSIELKNFAVFELGLPDNGSYTKYVDLQREFPVWNVVAAPEFSLDAKQWCYPVIGCASYRGYFKQSAAIAYAKEIGKEGFETMVGGAPAYSTLGWFSDPILPSMLRYGDADFAETLFHELAHQVLYINGDSDFNEAFATVVGEEGAQRWLRAYRPNDLRQYQARLAAIEDFNSLMAKSKKRLESVYQQRLPIEAMRIAKQAEFELLKQDYDLLKNQRWKGKGWFDNWFSTPLNNARLAAFSTYRERVPALRRLLETCNSDLPRFYKTLQEIKSANDEIVIPGVCN